MSVRLLREFDTQSLLVDPPEALPVLAEALIEHGLCSEDQVIAWLTAEISGWNLSSSPLLDTLVRVPSAFLLTFNYDGAIENAARKARLNPRSLGNSPADLEQGIEILAAKTAPERLTVLHLHGRAEHPEEMALAAHGYRRLQSELYQQVIRKLAVQKTMVFFGTELDEADFLSSIGRIPDGGSHLLFCLEATRRKLTQGRAPILPQRHDIYVVGVEHFDELVMKARRLLESEPSPEPSFVPPVELREGPYVTSTLRNLREQAPEGPEALAASILDADLPSQPNSGSEELLSGPRTLIIGDPGTGKTELLCRLAASATAQREAFVIRLADVELRRGHGALQSLSNWIQEGTAFQSGARVSTGILEQERFHFLLDGLDEVASERQEEMAQMINRCAQELPQHHFTLATRPLPSLDFLRIENPQSSDWTHLHLDPDAEWRDRYLAAVEITLERLEDDMPALASMEEVLNTPFYLHHIVELHREQRLRGLGDFGDLLRALVDRAIEREEGSVAIETPEIRDWLRRVALAGVLSGRRTFSEEDLRRVELPARTAEDQVGLARTLVQRLLLAEDGGSFRFHHRLLGERLAAEALVEAGPLPDLLDCLVPFLDRDLQGVRTDAVVPVGLACLVSDGFRAAVARRDPLAAARATPDRAPPEERERALAALWGDARHNQVWVWENGGELTDSAEAMGRLYRSLASTPTTKAILAAVNTPSAQDQGNALRVISRAQVDGLEGILREVLAQGDRNGVVLRQALVAAADNEIGELIEPIVQMLRNKRERVVHQVGVHALQRLVPPERRLAVFTDLMSGPEADYAVASVLRDLAPPEAMRLLAAYLAAGNEKSLWGRRRVGPIFEQLQIAELSEEEVAAAIDVAVGLHLDDERVAELCEHHPATVLRRLVWLAERERAWWELQHIAVNFEPAALLDAGLPDEVAERVDVFRTNRQRYAQAEADGTLELLLGDNEDLAEPDPPPTLTELLARVGSDPEILRNADYFASQVEDLDPIPLEELRRRLRGWWPQKPFRGTITREDPNGWSQEREAYAWMRLAPAARPALSESAWAELATCGILYDEHTAWLRETQTSVATYAALALIGDDGDPERWYQFLACCSDPLSNLLLARCAVVLDGDFTESPDPKRHMLRTIAERFLNSGRSDLAASVAGRSADFSELLAPLSAAAGDLDAQHRLLEALIQTLDADRVPEIDELHWITAVDSLSLLPSLFAVLERTYGVSEEMPARGVVAGYGLRDIVTPTVETIARIGGREAVAGYDRLISPESDFRWLSQARERVAGATLTLDGQRFAAQAAAATSIPLLAPEPDQFA